MVQYLLYKKRNNATPFMVINPDTINDTSTSVNFVGQQTTSYGQPMEQTTLWMLENFADNTPPSPAILGQLWFNGNGNTLGDNKIYVCTNENLQTFEKVSKPLVSASAPSNSILQQGDLWYNTTDGRLYSYNGTGWTVVGPSSLVPISVDVSYYMSAVTSDSTPTEMFINGVANNRLVMNSGPSNGQTWLYEIRLVGRAAESISENVCMNIMGVIDYPNGGLINLPSPPSYQIYNITSTLTTANVAVNANSIDNALQIIVTGQIGRTIQWNATVRTTIVSN